MPFFDENTPLPTHSRIPLTPSQVNNRIIPKAGRHSTFISKTVSQNGRTSLGTVSKIGVKGIRTESSSTTSNLGKPLVILKESDLKETNLAPLERRGVGLNDEYAALQGRMGRLETKVERYEQGNKDKLRTLDDRLTTLNAHLLYMLSDSPSARDLSSHTETVVHSGPSNQAPPFSVEGIRSPPVPALRKKLEAAEYERSLILETSQLIEFQEKGENEDSDAVGKDGAIEELRQTLKEQQENIHLLLSQNQKQAEQIDKLFSAFTAQQTLIKSLKDVRLDLSATRGQVLDLEDRMKEVEEEVDVGSASRILCLETFDTPTKSILRKRKFEDDNESEGLKDDHWNKKAPRCQ